MATLDFDAEGVEPMGSYELIPAGTEVLAMITDTGMVETQKKDGQYLKVEWEIVEGEYEGRKLWVNLNLDNPNDKAVEIAKRELSSICHATGKVKVGESEDLHGIPCYLKVGIKKGDSKYPEDKNVIKEYKAAALTDRHEPTTFKSNTPWGKK